MNESIIANVGTYRSFWSLEKYQKLDYGKVPRGITEQNKGKRMRKCASLKMQIQKKR